MDTSESRDDRQPGSGPWGPWVIELKIAGCTIRRRAARRRHLLDPGRVMQTFGSA